MQAIEDTYIRQLGWYNPAEHQHDKATFVGVGGIGSFAAFGAAKLGVPNITLIDPDVVEDHNAPSQHYSIHDAGDPKVDALSAQLCDVDEHTNVNAYMCAIDERGWDGSQESYPDLSGVVVSGLDSMEARQNLWDQQVKLKPRVPLYIDARLGGEIIVIYAVNPCDMQDIRAYEATLVSDEEAEDLPCTQRAVIDVGLFVGALITRHLRRYFTGESVDPVTVLHVGSLTVTKGPWPE